MAGNASQYRKFINYGGGEEDTGQGPTSSAPVAGPEAQAVLDRMVGLSGFERSAITGYVNGLVAAGLWTKVVDFWGLSLNADDFLTSFKGVVDYTLFGTTIHTPELGLRMAAQAYGRTTQLTNAILPGPNGAFGAYVKTFALDDKDQVIRYWGVNDDTTRSVLWWLGNVQLVADFRWGEEVEILYPSQERLLNDVIITGDDGAGLRYALAQGDNYITQPATFVGHPALPFSSNGTNRNGTQQNGRDVTDCCWFFLQDMTRANLTTFRALTLEFLRNLQIPDIAAT